MLAKEYFQQGQLSTAILELEDYLKTGQTGIAKENFLLQLYCIAGDYPKAQEQLGRIVSYDANASVYTSIIQQLIQAEQYRQECIKGNASPELLDVPSENIKIHLQALAELKNNNTKKAFDLLQKANEQQPIISGEVNGQAFNGMRDLEDLTANILELFTIIGKYYWLDITQIKNVNFFPPQQPLDLLWRRVHLITNNELEGTFYMPAIYVHTQNQADEEAKLGYSTRWQGERDSPVIGIGQRVYMVGDESLGIMEISSLTINGFN